ncbi:MAG TPA: cytochrome P450 [Gemmatimonadota bacterium]|nr:cytochrome P450 [Gemmatimonadota bacterium]
MTIAQIAGLVALASPLGIAATLFLVRGVPPRVNVLLGAGMLAVVAAAIWIVTRWPAAAAPLAALVLVGWSIMAWRARPSAGTRRRRPPGSLGLRSSIRALADYGFYEKEAARHGPIFKSNQYYRPVLCIVGLERCQRFLREHRDRLTSAPLPVDRYITGGLLRYMKAASHAEYRRRLQACMKAGVLAACEPEIREQATRELATLEEHSRGLESGARPFPAIDRFVFLSMNRVFFGILPDEPAWQRLARLYRVVDHRRLWRDTRRTRRAMEEIVAIIREKAARIERDGEPTSSSFLGQALRYDRDLLADPVFVENLAYFLHIARCDVTGLCGWLFKMLVDRPDWGARIREGGEETAAFGGTTAADRFVDETLRLRQSEYLYRTTADVIEFEGFAIPRGWLVRLCIRESHTAADAFEHPKEFDPDRFLDATYPRERYQPFGIYEHACVGVPLTKAVGRIFLEQLAGGFDWEVLRDGPMELGLHHHGHWRPSSRLGVRLAARPA